MTQVLSETIDHVTKFQLRSFSYCLHIYSFDHEITQLSGIRGSALLAANVTRKWVIIKLSCGCSEDTL